jgi:hypothetical protein
VPAPQPGVAPVPAQPSGEPTPGISEGNPFAQLGQAVRANRSALETQLASQIKFTEEEMGEFHEAPEKFLPKLVAKIQLDMVENTFGVMAQQIPVAVSGVMALERQNVKYEDAFYNRWPQLKKGNPQHESVIMQIGRAYVQANPKADLQTRMTHIGAQAVVALNLLPSVTAPPQAAVTPPAPAFSPAGNGSGAPAPSQKQLEGWELFDQQFGNFDT